VVPVQINEDWLVITRWITPVVYQPNFGDAWRAGGEIATEIREFRERNSSPEGGANGSP